MAWEQSKPMTRRCGQGLALLAVLTSMSPLIAAQTDTAVLGTAASAPDPRDLDCMATAISYEAGNEPVSGQEAVAQVVLNRLRAPDFPKTVCGVIFQGSTRRTGCQFTFTCDGSLLRPRSARSLAAARLIAERVLRGGGGAEIGDAVNYHADYVLPVWARTLDRVAKIGAHIFYRRPDGPGPRLSVGAAYVPVASSPALPLPGTFSPWGLPTLAISRTGRVRDVVLRSAPTEPDTGQRIYARQRDDQLAPGMRPTAVDASIDPARQRGVDQTVTIANWR